MTRHPHPVRFWIILGIAMLSPVTAYAIHLLGGFTEEVTRGVYAGSKAMLIALPVVGVLVLEHPIRAMHRLPPLPPPRYLVSLAWGIGIGLLIFGAMVGLMATPLSRFIDSGAPVVQEVLGKLGLTKNLVLYVCGVCFLHSALEEYYWRWFVYKRLRWHFPGWTSHIMAAVAFSLHHVLLCWIYFDIWVALFLGAMTGVGGFLWSYLYERTGTILGPWVSHVLADLAIFWVGLRLITAETVGL